MSVSHQHVKQAWKDKKRGNTAAQITAHALSSEQYYVTLFVRCIYLGTVLCAYERENNRRRKKIGIFFNA